MKISELITVLGFQVDDRELKRASSAVAEFKKMVAGIGIGYLMYQGAHAAATTAAAYQSSEAQFTTLLKSQVEAQKLMKDLFQYAKESTFEMTHVTKAQDILMSYGMEVGEAFEVMKRLGDVAGADANAFSRLALATAQVYGKTRLMGEEQRQFLNARGGMLAQEVANMYFGGDRAKMEAAQRTRKVSYEMMLAALRKLTDEGGRLYGNQANQMNTLLGRWNQMRDNLKMSGAMMVMAIERPLKAIMTFIANIDFTPIIGGFRMLGHALEYVASVVWQTGLRETWAEFVVEMRKLGFEFGNVTTKAGGLGTWLYGIGMAVRFFLTMVLTAIPLMVQFVLWGYQFANWLRVAAERFAHLIDRLAGLIKLVALLAGVAGAGSLGFLAARFIGTADIAVLSFSRITTGAISAARYFAAMLTPLGATILALGAMYIAYDRINNALEEKSELEARIKNSEDIANYTALASQAVSRYKGAVARGNKDGLAGQIASEEVDKFAAKLESLGALKSAAAMRGYRDRLRDGTYGKGAKPESGATEDGMPSLAKIMADPTGAIKDMQRLAEQGTKIQNVNIESNINVDVKGDPNANTGLTAQEVAELAKVAARSVFSMEVLAVTEGTL